MSPRTRRHRLQANTCSSHFAVFFWSRFCHLLGTLYVCWVVITFDTINSENVSPSYPVQQLTFVRYIRSFGISACMGKLSISSRSAYKPTSTSDTTGGFREYPDKHFWMLPTAAVNICTLVPALHVSNEHSHDRAGGGDHQP